jgi:hypothetical protein
MPKPDRFCTRCYLARVPAWPMKYCADCVKERVKDMTEYEEYLLQQVKQADQTIMRMDFNFNVLLGLVARLGGTKMHDEIVQEYERLMTIEEEE